MSLSKAGRELGKAGGPARAKKLSAAKRKSIASQGGKSGGRGRGKPGGKKK